MKTFVYLAMMAFLATACVNPVEAPSTSALPPSTPPPEGTPNSEQQGRAFSISTDAYYQATIQSANSPGKAISLSLSPTNKAEMVTNYLDNSKPVSDTGTWKTLENGNLHLNLRRVGAKDSMKLEFKTDGDKLVYTGDTYGIAGLILWVKPIPETK